MSEINQTEPVTSHSLKPEHVQIEQLRPEGREGIYVHQGKAAISHDGLILDSEGFSKCSAVVIQDNNSETAFLAHIDEWQMNDKMYNTIEELPDGQYSATFFVGSISRAGSDIVTNPKITRFMSVFSSGGKKILKVNPDVNFDSGNYHWGLSYDPKLKKATVVTKKDKMIREFNIS